MTQKREPFYREQNLHFKDEPQYVKEDAHRHKTVAGHQKHGVALIMNRKI